jgi:hypothetical protein
MRGAKLPEKEAPARGLLALVALVAWGACLATGSVSCASDHHVSPWGKQPGPSLDVFLRPPDLDAQLALLDAEAASARLLKTDEVPFDLPPAGKGAKAMARGYVGRDAAGRPVHATRVATPAGVVLAIGPLDAGDLDRSAATELVPQVALGSLDGAAMITTIPAGRDLNGDGSPDVVLRNDAGALAIWRITAIGSGAYAVTMETPPTRLVQLPDVPRAALWGELAVDAADPIAARLADVATFDGKGYSDHTDEARAWHVREAAARPATPPAGVTDATRLRLAMERAWHGILSGQGREAILADLGREPVPRALVSFYEANRRKVSAASGPPRVR